MSLALCNGDTSAERLLRMFSTGAKYRQEARAWSSGRVSTTMESEDAAYRPAAADVESSALAAQMPSHYDSRQERDSDERSSDTTTTLYTNPTPTPRRPRKCILKKLDLDEDAQNAVGKASSTPLENIAIRPSRPTRADSDSSTSSLDDDEVYSTPTDSSTGSGSLLTAILPSRLMMLAFTLLILISVLHETPFVAKSGTIILGAKAGIIDPSRIRGQDDVEGKLLASRQNTDPNVCSRWSQQSALVNGTIYVYGGHATTTQGQKSNTWTNDFFTIDVTKSWDISAPVVSGLAQPSGPPNVSNGYLWNSYTSLFLYGGEFSDNPFVTPSPFSLWEYDIASSSWTEHKNPQTSAGNNSDPANQPVQRSAEGAGISVPELGRGYYFAGHLDQSTTPGWSNQIFRTFLKSLLEYTFPGYSNTGVQSLSGGKTAGDDGTWRNITQGGIQDTATFPNRADSALVYVPGYGASGILVSIGGGTNVSFVSRIRVHVATQWSLTDIPLQTQMNVIDVFDIATSTWYKQSTAGSYPTLRVNPCAVAASAPDGSSTNIYMYGGQNLIPYMNQTQFGDTWVLTIPSFTWIQVDTTGQSVPPARVGHTCNIWDGQIVVVGGYNTDLAGGCDNGFYVFDATAMTWRNRFNAITGGNPQNQQLVQSNDSAALSGSYGYQVPVAVQSVIGGKGTGGATITAPAQSATAGPLATGKAITYTITGPGGAVVTETGAPGSVTFADGSHGPNIGAIVGGVLAGIFFLLAAYFAFCAWIYRRQLALYKSHVAMHQRAAAGAPGEKMAFLGAAAGGGVGKSSKQSSTLRAHSTDRSSGPAASSGLTSSGYEPVPPLPAGLGGAPVGGNSTANSSSEDLAGEPSFVGVLLNPRRSLRVINRD